MKEVIVVFDIGKTNKKMYLFNNAFEVVKKESVRFEETCDDDNYPCDDIELIENWIKKQIETIQKQGFFSIKAINFSTHGATVVYLDEEGKRITPLYNYLKPLETIDFTNFYEENGGVKEFSRKTASPAYGMLNSGLQMYWLKTKKTHSWNQVKSILHYPQYLSYLFTEKVTADFTSIGAHTAIWDFDNMKYHTWVSNENINLPEPSNGKEAIQANVNGEQIAVGMGLHDSSSSIIPLLKESKGEEFILLSTGTWIIAMNPFSKETLTQRELNNDCLCFMTPDKQQIKSSMQFLGRVHEVNSIELSTHFNVEKNHYLELELNEELCTSIFSNKKAIFFPNDDIASDFIGDLDQLKNFDNYEQAYYQLIYEISERVYVGIQRILDEQNNLKDVFISGGFNKNDIFVEYLSQMMPKQSIRFPEGKNASALGAALLMKDYLKESQPIKK